MHPAAIQSLMGSIAQELQDLQSRELPYRIKLGHLLREIQDRHLWDAFTPAYLSWGHFLEVGFEAFTGLAMRTAYDAIALAESHTLAALPPEKLARIPSVAIAKHIARMDRMKIPVTPEVLAQATKRNGTVKEFTRAAGAGEGYVVKLWVADVAAGKAAQALLESFFFAANRQHATAPAICNLARALGEARLQAHAPTPDEALDFLVAAAEDELRGLTLRAAAESMPFPEVRQ
jgi:hypothetical protein